jgi:cyclopropane fatty-acyl-phospholipid synthase-like methyltransferase
MEYVETIYAHPSFDRNRDPILEVLRDYLPPDARVLEIASGTGQHAVYFQAALPATKWQPSDPNPDCRESIAAWAERKKSKILPPLSIDVEAESWSLAEDQIFDAIVCINMIHTTPRSCTDGLIKHASKLLPKDGLLFFYGPFKRSGQHISEPNRLFDEDLRRRNSDWGIADVEIIISGAERQGLALSEIVEMPQNNLSVIFKRK